MLYEAWCGSRPSDAQLRVAQDIGLNGLHVMVNDHSRARSPRPFTMASVTTLRDTAKRITSAGLAVHFTTWVMPHRAYLEQLCDTLVPLAWEVAATSICLDAEEPWTHAHRPRMAYQDAADLLAERLLLPWGVTGIGLTSASKVGPLARAANYSLPQVYCTANNTLNPRTAPAGFERRWYRDLDAYHVDVALAAYRQSGRPGWDKFAFMRAQLDAARSTGAKRVVYWALRWIAGYRSTQNALRSLLLRC